MTTFFEGRLIVETGDITAKQVEAVVNAANSSLLGGGGVDGAIHRRGGPRILEECREIRNHRYPDGLPAGKAVITTAGNLPAEYVIHTVGPVWHGGSRDEDAVLARAYTNCLLLASETGIKTLAFPAISTGVYGFPKVRAAKIVFQTVRDFIHQHNLPMTIYMIFYSPGDEKIFLETLRTNNLE